MENLWKGFCARKCELPRFLLLLILVCGLEQSTVLRATASRLVDLPFWLDNVCCLHGRSWRPCHLFLLMSECFGRILKLAQFGLVQTLTERTSKSSSSCKCRVFMYLSLNSKVILTFAVEIWSFLMTLKIIDGRVFEELLIFVQWQVAIVMTLARPHWNEHWPSCNHCHSAKSHTPWERHKHQTVNSWPLPASGAAGFKCPPPSAASDGCGLN